MRATTSAITEHAVNHGKDSLVKEPDQMRKPNRVSTISVATRACDMYRTYTEQNLIRHQQVRNNYHQNNDHHLIHKQSICECVPIRAGQACFPNLNVRHKFSLCHILPHLMAKMYLNSNFS